MDRSKLDKHAQVGPVDQCPVVVRILAPMISLLCFWAIMVYTLPGPLSVYAPDAALWLNGSHPEALLAKAESLRDRAQELTAQNENLPRPVETHSIAPAEQPAAAPAPPAPRRPRVDRSLPDAGTGRFANPMLTAKRTGPGELADLKAEMAALAQRVIDRAPMNARAYRLLAETREDREEVRGLMQKAAQLSPRETFALAWLLADAVERSDMPVLVDIADRIMRTRPDLVVPLASQTAHALSQADGRTLLVSRLSEDPAWRETFLRVLPDQVTDHSALLELFLDIARTRTPPTVAELLNLIVSLLGREDPELAHEAWRKLVPPNESGERGQIYNARFDRPFSGYAFDWVPVAIEGARVDQVDTEFGQKALRIRFDGRRVRLLSVRQIVLMNPGTYRIAGRFRGWLAAQRGMRWQMRCLYGTRELLGQTDLLAKSDGEWAQFDFSFEVIEIDACKAQMLVLVHDSRSASEEIVSGEIQFDDLVLARIAGAGVTGDTQSASRPEGATKN